MSAPAIKSSMPGVGTPVTQTSHTMLPMNMVSQKMVQSTDQSAASVKPLQNPNLNYVPLQTSGQPLSLIQEHRPPYQPAFGNNIPMDQQQSALQQSSLPQQHQLPPQPLSQQQMPSQLLHKETDQQHNQDSTKLVQNGTEQSKAEKDKTSLAPSLTVPNTTSAPQLTTPKNAILTTPDSSVPQLTTLQTNTMTAATTISPVKSTGTPAGDNHPKVNNSSVAVTNAVSQQQADGDKAKTNDAKPTDNQAQQLQQKKPEETKSTAAATGGQKVEAPATQGTGSPSKTAQQPALKAEESSPAKTEKSPQKVAHKVTKSESPEKVETEEAKTPVQTPAAKRKTREPRELKTPSYVTEATAASSRSRRARVQTTPYQSPVVQYPPTSAKETPKQKPSKHADDKLIVFYKNEFLAVRNPEGSFYVCQALQNIYKTSKRIRIRWLSQDKSNGDIYSPDFYDNTDFDCILTNLNLNKKEKDRYELTRYDLLRTENILKKAMDVEAGIDTPAVNEDNPFGLDISLYKDEAQLQKLAKDEKIANKSGGKSGKSRAKRPRKKAKHSDSEEDDDEDLDESDEDENETSSDSDENAIKSADSTRKSSKKRSAAARSGALAQMQATPKGPTRAERALNRSKGPIGPSTSGMAGPSGTSSVKKTIAEPKKAVEPKKPAPPVAAPAAPATTAGIARTKAKTTGSVATPSTSVAPAPAPVPSTSDAKASSRPKRVATNVTPASTVQEEPVPSTSSARKKPRSRA